MSSSDTLLAPKLGLLVSVGIVTLGAAVLPFVIARNISGRRAMKIISTGSACSAGIVVGALLCHLLPEASSSYAEYCAVKYPDDEKYADYPFAGIACGGILSLLVAIDALIVKRGFTDDHVDEHGHNHDHITEALQKMRQVTYGTQKGSENGRSVTKDAAYSSIAPRVVVADRHVDVSHARENELVPPVVHHSIENTYQYEIKRPAEHDHALGDDEAHDAHALLPGISSTAPELHAVRRRTLVRAWVFFFALSLHGLFDGLSIGSEETTANFSSTAVAVASHKFFDGLALGCALFPAYLPTSHRWALLIISSLTTPLGIGIGIGASSALNGTDAMLVNAIVLSMASGSFAYISLMELLPSSLADGQWIPLKLTCFVLGFAAMAFIGFYV